MTQEKQGSEVSIEELKARKPNLDLSTYSEAVDASISTTILLEGDLVQLLRDYYQNGDFDNYDLWSVEILKKIQKSLQGTMLDLQGETKLSTTIAIKFNRS